MLRQMSYFPRWYFRTRIQKEQRPLQTVLFVTDCCNLKCKHCMQEGHGCTTMKPYKQIRQELIASYKMGSRFVDFEGGEPTLWREGKRSLNDLYRLARKVGFFSCTLTTNGQTDFSDTLADSVWVSVDGYRSVHDAVRGEGTFEKLDRNIGRSGHPAMSISMSVNRLNRASVSATAAYAKKNPAIRSIAFNFHTPFPGTESLMMDWEERCDVIDEILALKAAGYPVMNTVSGLRMMKKRGFTKECWIANYILVDGTHLSCCPGSVMGTCDDCGFCMAGEMYSLMHLRPDTIAAGLKLRMHEGG